MSDPKDPAEPEAQVIAIEDARKRAEEKAAGPTVDEPLSPGAAIMATIAQELAGLAGPDGVVRLGGQDAVARERTAAVLRGLGAGLGAAIADAFTKWAEKVQVQAQAQPETTPAAPAADPDADPNAPKGQA